MIKQWTIHEKNIEKAKKIEEKFQVNHLVAEIIANKDMTDEEIEIFLNPTRNDFYDPFSLPDMEIAVERIIEAIENKEKIVIYGDYDVDGITSVTVLKQFLENRGLIADWYIPNRLDEGYGLNKEAIEKLAKQGYSLLITVDCGITSVEEVSVANELGMQVIITDHHEVGESLPKALAIVDAKRKDNQYPFNQLAGVGTVFKLIQAISIKKNLEQKEYLKYLDIVCIGTISDIVPLVDENRVITKLGLKLVERTKNIGLRTLLQLSGYRKIDSTTISFGIAPRINACGRMGYAKEALELFLTQNEEEANKIAQKLNEYNKQRQDTEKEIFEQAIIKIEKENSLKKQNKEEIPPVIVLADKRWHHGVIGIVSSKVTEKYFKPSILVCLEDEIGKGSGRSIPGFDLHKALMECGEKLEKFGGHSMAVGVTIKEENIEGFKKDFVQYAKNNNIDSIIPVIAIDNEIGSLGEIKIEDVAELQLLEPFGEANKEPLFLFKNLKINSIRTLSDGKHLKLSLKEESFIIDAIGFSLGELAEEYKISDKVDVVGTLEINEFGGMQSIQIKIKDIRKSY